MALLPVLLFAVLHSASYSLTLLDALGQPNDWWGAKFLISIVELQSRNILRMISFSEIFLMPMTVVYLFSGRTWLVVPLVYYRFLGLRYTSRRNPYTRAVFYELRLGLEETASHPNMPVFVQNLIWPFLDRFSMSLDIVELFEVVDDGGFATPDVAFDGNHHRPLNTTTL